MYIKCTLLFCLKTLMISQKTFLGQASTLNCLGIISIVYFIFQLQVQQELNGNFLLFVCHRYIKCTLLFCLKTLMISQKTFLGQAL